MTSSMTSIMSELSVPEIIDLKQVFFLKRKLVKPRKIVYPCGAVYKGETKGKLPHGWGEIRYKNNTVVAAKWVDGLATGKGVCMSYEMTYKGDFVENKFHGKGRLFFNDDREYYEGSFINNEKSGQGRVLFESGCSYVGQWKNDEMNGIGSLCAQGNVYVGKWTDGQLAKDGLVVRND